MRRSSVGTTLVKGDITTKMIGDQDNSKSGRLARFYAEHGVSLPMNTNYALDAFTLRKDDHSHIVFIMDKVNASSEKDGTQEDYEMHRFDKVRVEESTEKADGRYFSLCTRESEESVILEESHRHFGEKYEHSLPILSHD